jgi:ATP-dependent exoDNAse (exonuclease V) beta subunit
MTRARQELWLSWNYAPKARGSVETPPLLKDVEVGVQVETLSGEEEKKAKPKAKSKLAFDAVEGWIQARKQVEARALESMRKSFLLPSQEEEIFARVKENPEEKGEERERRGALELGTLCHFILLREPRGDLEERMELAREWISREHDLGEPFGKFLWEQCAEIFENFEKSVLQERLRAGELRGRELPILHLDAEGKPWRGTVDLLLEEKGELVVVDYKTNKLGREGILPLASRYQGQLQIYTEAIQQAYSLDQPPHGEIWALRSGQSFRYPKA